MLNIRVDNALAAYLGSKKIRLEELFVIICFNLGKLDLLKDYLSNKNGDQLGAYLAPLERKLLLKRLSESDVFDWDNYELTDLADEIFDECNQHLFEGNIEGHIEQFVVPKEDESWEKFIEDFQGKFPVGIRNRSGMSIRSHKVDVSKKMKTFFTKYKGYTREQVLMAVDVYLSKMRREGYAWCMCSHYFILKNGVSVLAGECEEVVKGKTEVSEGWDQGM
jgi:hypothetical protein